MITCYTASVSLTRKYRMTMTFCSPRDQSTGRETCWAGMVSDQLLGTRQSENGVKWGKNGANYGNYCTLIKATCSTYREDSISQKM